MLLTHHFARYPGIPGSTLRALLSTREFLDAIERAVPRTFEDRHSRIDGCARRAAQNRVRKYLTRFSTRFDRCGGTRRRLPPNPRQFMSSAHICCAAPRKTYRAHSRAQNGVEGVEKDDGIEGYDDSFIVRTLCRQRSPRRDETSCCRRAASRSSDATCSSDFAI